MNSNDLEAIRAMIRTEVAQFAFLDDELRYLRSKIDNIYRKLSAFNVTEAEIKSEIKEVKKRLDSLHSDVQMHEGRLDSVTVVTSPIRHAFKVVLKVLSYVVTAVVSVLVTHHMN